MYFLPFQITYIVELLVVITRRKILSGSPCTERQGRLRSEVKGAAQYIKGADSFSPKDIGNKNNSHTPKQTINNRANKIKVRKGGGRRAERRQRPGHLQP